MNNFSNFYFIFFSKCENVFDVDSGLWKFGPSAPSKMKVPNNSFDENF